MKQDFVEHNRIIAQYFNKYEETEERNQHIGLYEKWQTLAEILPVMEGTKWIHVGD